MGHERADTARLVPDSVARHVRPEKIPTRLQSLRSWPRVGHRHRGTCREAQVGRPRPRRDTDKRFDQPAQAPKAAMLSGC